MPEIKYNFLQGKMNKDLDERLVPNGQYRDALNIKISTSDNDDIGTAQNIKGNTLLDTTNNNKIAAGSTIVGSISDEKNNSIYWLVAGPAVNINTFSSSSTQPTINKDLILEYNSSTNEITPVFVDVYKVLLTIEQGSTDITHNSTNKTITFPSASLISSLSVGMFLQVSDGVGQSTVFANNQITDITGTTITLENSIDAMDHLNLDTSQAARDATVLIFSMPGSKRVLNFDNTGVKKITGINIIEDLLFFTDNATEPKKINITRSKAGTPDFDTHTNLYISSLNTNAGKVKEENVTVIKKSPLEAPAVELFKLRQNVDNFTTTFDFTNFSTNDDQKNITLTLNQSNNSFKHNDIILLHSTSTPSIDNHQVRLKVTSIDNNNVNCIIESMPSNAGSNTFNIALYSIQKPLFEDKFSSFAVRWKYVDGEYSTFSPFSKTAFLPSNFSYEPQTAHNTGMSNDLKEVVIKDFIPYNIPNDVVQIDILYKESDSTTIYSIDSVKKEDDNSSSTNAWNTSNGGNHAQGFFKITSENIYAVLPSNQLLRPFDNVPRKALGQDLIGNRLIYGNYLQNFDLINNITNKIPVKPNFNVFVDKRNTFGSELVVNRFLTDNRNSWEFFTNSSTTRTFIWQSSLGAINIVGSTSGTQYDYMFQEIPAVKDNKTYLLKFTITNYNGGKLHPVLVGDNLISDPDLRISANGDYSIKLTIDNNIPPGNFNHAARASATTQSFVKNSLQFTTRSSPTSFLGIIDNFSLREITEDTKRSLKSQRDYQVGVVYADEYGRQTPVLTDKSASVSIAKADSININSFKSKLTNQPPYWSTHFKYFIKETSSEYDNLAVDRIYKAQDQNVWISFPSSERNKVQEEDFLILKKAHNSSLAVIDEEAKYKIIAISNEAPEFVRTFRATLAQTGVGTTNMNNLFGNVDFRPVASLIKIAISKDEWMNTHSGPDISNLTNLSLQFKNAAGQSSRIYRVENFYVDDLYQGVDYYYFTLDQGFLSQDADFVKSGNDIAPTVSLTIYENKIRNTSEYDGRFFVKILYDTFIRDNIYNNINFGANTIIEEQNQFYFLQDNLINGTNTARTAQNSGVGTSLFTANSSGNPKFICSFEENPGDSTCHAKKGMWVHRPSGSTTVSKTSSFSCNYGLIVIESGSSSSDAIILGSETAEAKFQKILKFESGEDGDNSNTASNWFIDNISYVGVQPGSNLDPTLNTVFPHTYRFNHKNGIQRCQVKVDTVNFVDDITTIATTAPTNQRLLDVFTHGFEIGRGIFTATASHVEDDNFFTENNHYMEIAFAGIKNDISAGNYDNPSAWQNAWEVGNSNNTQHDEEINFVSQLVVGNKFKFSNDTSGEIYTITKVKKERRYNHTRHPSGNLFAINGVDVTWEDLHSNAGHSINIATFDSDNHLQGSFVFTGTINLSSIFGSASTPASSVVDERERFGKATNRRLTYVLELDKRPGANGTFDPTSTLTNVQTGAFMQFIGVDIDEENQITSGNPAIFETQPKERVDLDIYYEASDFYNIEEHGLTQELPWSNCFSFGNGVESNRIKDAFNKVTIGKGAVASTTLEGQYKEDRRTSGLIFSGIYNSTTNVNDLNQFIQAEKITKDINPTYGSIQKLFARNSDLVVLCEDKVLKILANKDAVFNADGNPQLTANNNVLGQSIPFVGEYGISKDPNSFASESYRAYFTDKQRRAVLRLSMDGLTDISDAGMSDWFSDNLPNADSIVGSYDADSKEYNVTLIDNDSDDYTVSFTEKVRGWVSFKSYIPEDGLSLNNVYYTFKDGKIYSHGTNTNRNTFYESGYRYNSSSSSNFEPSSITLILNEAPSEIKNFKTISYEGSQAKVDAYTSDDNYYNLSAKTGWSIESINTENQEGTLNEFIEKEGKWYNYIKGVTTTSSNIDTLEFSVQGLGVISSTSYQS